MFLTLNSYITIAYDIEPMKYINMNSCPDKGNFEEKAKAISEYIKNYPTEYDDELFPSICFNCHIIESACFISILELIKIIHQYIFVNIVVITLFLLQKEYFIL